MQTQNIAVYTDAGVVYTPKWLLSVVAIITMNNLSFDN